MAVTQAMQGHVRDRVQKVAKHFDGMQNVQVTLSLEGGRHMAEMLVTAKRGRLVGKATDADDMYAAIDAAAEKLARQVTRFKERRQDHRHEKKASKALAQEPSETAEDVGRDEDTCELEEESDGLRGEGSTERSSS